MKYLNFRSLYSNEYDSVTKNTIQFQAGYILERGLLILFVKSKDNQTYGKYIFLM